MNLSNNFKENMKIILKDEYEDFLNCFGAKAKKGLRINTTKIEDKDLMSLLNIDLKSVPMLKKLIQLWVESDFRASKTNRKVCEADLLNYMKTKTNAKGIRRNGFERLENALRNGQTGLLIEVLKK